jgi:ectoine hydroxylase-related dioxygenase (phytanoyl-CoA dioxygenase family)
VWPEYYLRLTLLLQATFSYFSELIVSHTLMNAHKTRDLSQYHHPLTELFQIPDSGEAWGPYRLSEEQVAFFMEHGYVSGIKLLDDGQIEWLKKELDSLMDPEHPGNQLFYEYHTNEASDPEKTLFHALGAWRITPGLHDILWNPAFLMAASQLLGNRSVRFWHDQLFCKPARHGGVVAWHQDYSYWTRTKPMAHLTCWIGLDDSTEENGCLQYIPGSHLWGLLDKPELAGEMDGLLEFLTPEQKKAFKPVPIELKKGHAAIHHPLLIHGSYANNSERPRRAIVLNVFADGTESDTDQPLLDGVPVIHRKEKMSGQFFPLLFDAM